MTSTVFTDFVGPPVNAAWLNDVNNSVYNGKGPGGVPGASVQVYQPAGTGAVARTTQDKLSESVSVLDFNAKGDGVTDDTAAFNAAIATGKKVTVPYTASGYVVNNITVVTNMVIVGEKPGISNGPTLIVSTNNSAAFTVTTQAFQIEISNFTITAATGITGARAYKQLDKSYYTAYARFTGIETSSKLAVSYDLFPIFTVWNDCRDGYIDSALAQGHQAINATPALWNQGNQCNINKIENSSFWGCNGTSMAGTSAFAAALDIGYGDTWTFDNVDFEAMSIVAHRLRGIVNARSSGCRYEGIAGTSNITVDISPTSAIGSDLTLTNCVGFLGSCTGQFVGIGTSSSVSASHCLFYQIPAGVVLSGSPAQIQEAVNVGVLGAGAVGFLSGVNTTRYAGGKTFVNGATDNASGAISQLTGIQSASIGFTSTYNVAVSTAFVTIAAFNFIGGLAMINGYNTVGGAAGMWLVFYRNGAVVVVSSSDATLTTPSFQMSGANLQMKTTTGTLAVSTANLV